jgi:molecular chaperone GrpE
MIDETQQTTDIEETNEGGEPIADIEYDEDIGALGMKKLREKNKLLVEENRQLLDSLQRMRADVVNRDRATAETQSRVKDMVKEGMLEELLPVLDAFTAAMSGPAWEAVDTKWRVGVEYIYSQLVKVLTDNGVEQYGAVGDSYNPHMHDLAEALPEGVVPEEGAKITAVVRAGYNMGQRIIRAAGVRI